MEIRRHTLIFGGLGFGMVLLLIAIVVMNNDASEAASQLESGKLTSPLQTTEAGPRRGTRPGDNSRQRSLDVEEDKGKASEKAEVLSPAIRGIVVHSRGVAVSGARIELLHLDSSGAGGMTSLALTEQVSSSDGSFEFVGAFELLRMGIRVTHPNFATQELLSVVASTERSGAYSIELRSGLELRVLAVRADGQPVPGVELFVSDVSLNGQTYSSDVERSSMTDEQGVASFQNLSKGRKLVVLSAAGLCARGVFVQVTDREQARIRLLVSEGRTVNGRVVDQEGRQVSGALVIPQTPQSPGVLRRDVFASTMTDQDGTFRCAGLPVGFVGLNVEMPGYTPAIGRASLVRPQDDSVEIVLNKCEQRGLEIVVRSGDDVPERLILLMTRTPSIRAPQLRSAQQFVGHDGVLTFSVPPSTRTYFLHVLCDGFAPATSQSLKAGDQDRVVIALGQGARISGIVTDRQGKPVAGATVGLFRTQFTRALRLLGGALQTKPMKEFRTESGGKYRFERVPLGSWRLQVRHGGFAQFVTDSEIQLVDGDNRTQGPLQLSRGGGIVGYVLRTDGLPAAGAVVRFFRWGEKTGALTVVADDEGHFRLDRIPEGRYRIHLSGIGVNPYDPAREGGRSGNPLEVTVVEGELVTISIP